MSVCVPVCVCGSLAGLGHGLLNWVAAGQRLPRQREIAYFFFFRFVLLCELRLSFVSVSVGRHDVFVGSVGQSIVLGLCV